MIPLSELEKLRIGCERGNLKQVSATEFLALFEQLVAERTFSSIEIKRILSKSHKDTERLDKLEVVGEVRISKMRLQGGGIAFTVASEFSCMADGADLRSAIDSLKKD